MYTDIFRFNLNDFNRNLIILILLSIVIHKYLRIRYDIGINININIKVTIVFSLILAIIPNRLILQGGLNIYYIFFTGLIFRFVRNYTRYKHYKIIPSSPILIIPLIIIIEFVRYLIRPLSLILRIIINLTIGHIVIYILLYPFSIFYNLIEIFIYSIQIYIF